MSAHTVFTITSAFAGRLISTLHGFDQAALDEVRRNRNGLYCGPGVPALQRAAARENTRRKAVRAADVEEVNTRYGCLKSGISRDTGEEVVRWYRYASPEAAQAAEEDLTEHLSEGSDYVRFGSWFIGHCRVAGSTLLVTHYLNV
jgi:hypothetical protein